MQFQCKQSAVTKALNISLIFTCFFILCKYWNDSQIITKIICDGLYSMSVNIYILLCTDYSQAFFLSLMWSNVANDFNLEKKNNAWFSHKISQNEQVMIICNTFNAKWSL